MDFQQIAASVAAEAERAGGMFEPMHSLHEALGVILEEFAEFQDEVFAFNLRKGRDTRAKARTELTQLAAMCLRAIHDLELPEEVKQ